MEKGTNRSDPDPMGGLIDADSGASPVAFMPSAVRPPGTQLFSGERVGFTRASMNSQQATSVSRLAMELGMIVSDPPEIAPDKGGAPLPLAGDALVSAGLRFVIGDRVRFHRHGDGRLLVVKRSRAKRL